MHIIRCPSPKDQCPSTALHLQPVPAVRHTAAYGGTAARLVSSSANLPSISKPWSPNWGLVTACSMQSSGQPRPTIRRRLVITRCPRAYSFPITPHCDWRQISLDRSTYMESSIEQQPARQCPAPADESQQDFRSRSRRSRPDRRPLVSWSLGLGPGLWACCRTPWRPCFPALAAAVYRSDSRIPRAARRARTGFRSVWSVS